MHVSPGRPGVNFILSAGWSWGGFIDSLGAIMLYKLTNIRRDRKRLKAMYDQGYRAGSGSGIGTINLILTGEGHDPS